MAPKTRSDTGRRQKAKAQKAKSQKAKAQKAKAQEAEAQKAKAQKEKDQKPKAQKPKIAITRILSSPDDLFIDSVTGTAFKFVSSERIAELLGSEPKQCKVVRKLGLRKALSMNYDVPDWELVKEYIRGFDIEKQGSDFRGQFLKFDMEMLRAAFKLPLGDASFVKERWNGEAMSRFFKYKRNVGGKYCLDWLQPDFKHWEGPIRVVMELLLGKRRPSSCTGKIVWYFDTFLTAHKKGSARRPDWARLMYDEMVAELVLLKKHFLAGKDENAKNVPCFLGTAVTHILKYYRELQARVDEGSTHSASSASHTSSEHPTKRPRRDDGRSYDRISKRCRHVHDRGPEANAGVSQREEFQDDDRELLELELQDHKSQLAAFRDKVREHEQTIADLERRREEASCERSLTVSRLEGEVNDLKNAQLTNLAKIQSSILDMHSGMKEHVQTTDGLRLQLQSALSERERDTVDNSIEMTDLRTALGRAQVATNMVREQLQAKEKEHRELMQSAANKLATQKAELLALDLQHQQANEKEMAKRLGDLERLNEEEREKRLDDLARLQRKLDEVTKIHSLCQPRLDMVTERAKETNLKYENAVAMLDRMLEKDASQDATELLNAKEAPTGRYPASRAASTTRRSAASPIAHGTGIIAGAEVGQKTYTTTSLVGALGTSRDRGTTQTRSTTPILVASNTGTITGAALGPQSESITSLAAAPGTSRDRGTTQTGSTTPILVASNTGTITGAALGPQSESITSLAAAPGTSRDRGTTQTGSTTPILVASNTGTITGAAVGPQSESITSLAVAPGSSKKAGTTRTATILKGAESIALEEKPDSPESQVGESDSDKSDSSDVSESEDPWWMSLPQDAPQASMNGDLKEVADPPRGYLSITPKEHQRIGLAWMLERESEKGWSPRGGLLADDQGMGKTLQAIMLILKERPKGSCTLVVCPVAVMGQWKSEIEDKCTEKANVKVLVYHGRNRKGPSGPNFENYTVVVTSYQTLAWEWKGEEGDALMEESPCFTMPWRRVILDECQYIKNKNTKVALAVCALKATARWCMTGTPLQNTVDDLYSIFRFLRYKALQNFKDFKNLKLKIRQNYRAGMETLRYHVEKQTLRRLKSILNLPEKKSEIFEIGFAEDSHRKLYDRIIQKSLELWMERQGGEGKPAGSALALLMRCRQACVHPALAQGKSKETSATKLKRARPHMEGLQKVVNALDFDSKCQVCQGELLDEIYIAVNCKHIYCQGCAMEISNSSTDLPCLVQGCKKKTELVSIDVVNGDLDFGPSVVNDHTRSSKIEAVVSYVKKLPPKSQQHSGRGKVATEKAIVFSQWTSALALLQTRLHEEGIKWDRLDGSMTSIKRQTALRNFHEDDEVQVILISLMAGNCGLNIVAANHVIMLDLWWNPTVEDQAVDRVHRIGQTREVKVVRFIIKDSIEGRVLRLQAKKRSMSNSIFSATITDKPKYTLTSQEQGRKDMSFLLGRYEY